MGRLIAVTEFGKGLTRNDRDRCRIDPVWYFSDLQYPKIEESYPSRLSIHRDLLEGGPYDEPSKQEAGVSRIEIRKFIERDLDGDVVWSKEDLTHVRVYPAHSDGKRYSTSFAHGYYIFHFETDNEAFHFKLRFGELTKTPTAYHPKNPPTPGNDDFHGNDAWMRARELTGGRDW